MWRPEVDVGCLPGSFSISSIETNLLLNLELTVSQLALGSASQVPMLQAGLPHLSAFSRG